MLTYNNFKTKNIKTLQKVYNYLVEKVQTVMNKSIDEEVFKYHNTLFDTSLKINIKGLPVERSYEDRSVYLNLTYNDKEKIEFTTWLNGEDAIKLGQILIKHGLYSLESNMINHQKIHHYNQLKSFFNEDRIDKIILTNINNVTTEYTGRYTFNIKPIWKKDKAPKYNEDFNFDDNIYFSPFEKEFKAQLKEFGGINNIEFTNYNWENEVEKFKNFSKEYEMSIYEVYNKIKYQYYDNNI